jgi:rhodanese-related sulfurtransferase
MTNPADQNDQFNNQNGIESDNNRPPTTEESNEQQNMSAQSVAQQDKLDRAVADGVAKAKSKVTQPLPDAPTMSGSQASPKEVLNRLNWGEPALTIIDIRSREAFNDERIKGAVPMSLDLLPKSAEANLEYRRDIYIYGDSDENATEAVNRLRQAGYTSVAAIQGGLSGWKAINAPTEGITAFSSPALA